MERKNEIKVLLFGSLYDFQKEKGMATTFDFPLASAGKLAIEIAGELGLPLETIGAIYHNRRPENLQQRIMPGDRVAFVPKSIHGPHKCLQGLPVHAPGLFFPKVA